MDSREKIFKKKSEDIAFDIRHRDVIRYNISQYNDAVTKGMSYFSSLEEARNQASGVKDYVLEDLDHLLLEFEEKAKANGSEVYWASSKHEVIFILGRIIEVEAIKRVVKMKSMISEELGLNEFLLDKQVEYWETDLGEFIVQVAGERPYHILTPAMHKSKETVARLFKEKFGLEAGSTPEQVTTFVREYLRNKFTSSDLGITGANFLVADTGSVGLTENEGNGINTFSWPGVLLVIAGIEKVIPNMEDLDLFLPLLSVHGTGQHLTAYNSLLNGPKRVRELDGPERMIIILFDGGRSKLFDSQEQKQALKCIRCGACLNVCPVYKTIGGHTYDTTYTGPIGSVISMYLEGSEETGHLNFASSLCGKCTEVCPVKIPLHRLLLLNRKQLVDSSKRMGIERFFFRNYKRMMLKRSKLERVSSKWKNRAMKGIGSKVWGPRRASLTFAKESFHKTWMKKNP